MNQRGVYFMNGKAVIKPDADEILTAALTPFD
jgi:hypothetical protein